MALKTLVTIMNKHKLINKTIMKKGILFGIFICIGTFSNAATINITNTNDSGAGSLRQAISDANSLSGTDTIDATGINGTIALLSALPTITESVIINGPTVGNLTLDAGGSFRVLQLSSGNNVINYLTITNGATSTMYGGAGIYNTGTSLILDHCIISNNSNTSVSGNRYAGGIYSEGILDMTYCRVTNNSCSIPDGEFFGNQGGGGIYLAGYSDVSISNCLIDNNSLNGGTNKNGAGIAFDDNSNFSGPPGKLNISNSTISGNTINNGTNNSGSGISIENFNNASINISQSTIAYNICQGGSNNNGAYSDQGFSTASIIQSNIFSNNIPENIEAFSLLSLGSNIKDDNSGFYTPHPSDLNNTDPLLLPLSDNGGYTLTHAISCTSPAIDYGTGVLYDQRDSLAVDSLRDVGAYEAQPSYGIDTRTECTPYTWINGINYTTNNNSATFNIVGGAVDGCDSLVTLDLTIKSVSDLTTTTAGLAVSANNTNATYKWLDCDNNYAIIDGEIGQTFTATANGNYAVELTENGCVDTSTCVAITTIGILENSLGNDLLIYPNPTSGNFSIDLGAIYQNAQILITDISGKLIHSKNIVQSKVINLSLEAPAGVYIVSIHADNKKAVIRLVKE